MRKMRSTASRIVAALIVLMTITPSLSVGQSVRSYRSTQAAQTTAHDRFGWRVQAFGDWAVITNPFEDVNGIVSAGRVYLHSGTQGWQQVQYLEAPDPQTARTFGMSVALSDEVMVVGAPGDHEGALMAGAVYVFTLNDNSWGLTAKVLSPEPVMGSRFGGAVDISQHLLVVGAHRSMGSSEKSGSVYVFQRDTTAWVFVTELIPDAILPDEAFGTMVRILDDSTIAVGRSMADPIEGRHEKVSVFAHRGAHWSSSDLVLPPTGSSDLLGTAIAVNERSIAVGVPGRTVAGNRIGGIYLYDRETLLFGQVIESPEPSALVYFGGSLSLTEDRMYVGCVQTKGTDRQPMGMVAGYDLATLGEGPSTWYPLGDQEGLPHACPQVSATDSIVLVSSPFNDLNGVIDAGVAHFFPRSGVVEVDEPDIPFEYALEQNYPNPFNSMTRIDFSLKAAGRVHLDVYNILGQRVATILNEEMKAGRQSATFDAGSFASGVYFYRIAANDFVGLKKMLLLK